MARSQRRAEAVLILDRIDRAVLIDVLIKPGGDVNETGGDVGGIGLGGDAVKCSLPFSGCGEELRAVRRLRRAAQSGDVEPAELIDGGLVHFKQTLLNQRRCGGDIAGFARNPFGDQHEPAQVFEPQSRALGPGKPGIGGGDAGFAVLAAPFSGRRFPGFTGGRSRVASHASLAARSIGATASFPAACGQSERGSHAGAAPKTILPTDHVNTPGRNLDEMRVIRNKQNMSLILERVLEPEDLDRVRAGLDALPWAPGRRTAGAAARSVKENLQADGADPRTHALERFVAEALARHPLFEIAARPARVSRLLFSRYEPGMAYGLHTDDALMGAGDDKLRSDLALTLFLADPESYDGGELVVQSALGDQSIKLAAGDAILYPAGSIHMVAPVTRGVRFACVGWIESYLADAAQRDILFDLSVLRARVSEAGLARDDVLRLDKSISNLLRMWARG